MKRRNFIATTVAALPALAFGQELSAKEKRTKKGFVVKATESRFGEKTMLFGNCPNDIK
ncbi:MAG: cupin, partial [Saprospiraceae bacterium]|nr:cupin [Saprospiraceae bacterium]